ncbi:hypothetical protein ACIQU4_11245 [Streptomyces sp. NPDC090741]|uniref:hypothetical protein n=1 Tax=Streptomyces sp. NPDC090741 TaxID=3365967 RepID=UPI00380100AF
MTEWRPARHLVEASSTSGCARAITESPERFDRRGVRRYVKRFADRLIDAFAQSGKAGVDPGDGPLFRARPPWGGSAPPGRNISSRDSRAWSCQMWNNSPFQAMDCTQNSATRSVRYSVRVPRRVL